MDWLRKYDEFGHVSAYVSACGAYRIERNYADDIGGVCVSGFSPFRVKDGENLAGRWPGEISRLGDAKRMCEKDLGV